MDRRFLQSVVLAWCLAHPDALAASREVVTPMACSLGGSPKFHATVTMPDVIPEGGTFVVRIDSMPSGKLTALGLNFVHEMRTDYELPKGARYVEGSARIVPGSGTPNALTGATVWHDEAGLHVLLGARIAQGDEYTPPSVELQLIADAPAGSLLVLSFLHYEVIANVVVLGNLRTKCDPRPRPFPIGSARIISALQPATLRRN